MRRSALAFCTLVLLLLLAACSQQQLPSVTLPSDVEGTVVDILGGGVGGMNVAVGNKITVTSSDGSFTLENIDSPFDLVNYSADTGHVIEGVTSFTPTVVPLGILTGDVLSGIDSATISGSFGAAVPADHEARVCVEGLDTMVVGCTTSVAGDTTYSSLTASWTDGGPVDVRIHVLFIAIDADGLPTGYGSYGTATATVGAGDTPAVDVTLGGAPTATTVAVSVTVPAGLDLGSLWGMVRISDGFILPLFDASGTLPTDFNIPMPRIGQQRYQFVAQAEESSGNGESIAWAHDVAAGGSTTLVVPEPPRFTTPGDGATGITLASPFTIDVASEGINTFYFDGLSDNFAVTTTDKTSTMPDLSLYGLPVPAATSFYTLVIHVPIGEANEITSSWLSDYVDLALAIGLGGPGLSRDGALSATSIDVTTQ